MKKKQIATACKRLLSLLADKKSHTTREMVRTAGHRFGSVVHHLRHQLHHDIAVSRHRKLPHQWEYRLILPK